MGQKTHPYGFRLGITKTWRSRWFAKADYSRVLQEDQRLKESLVKRLKAAGLSSIEVDRPGNKLRITIRTSRPGIVIGRKGAEIEKLKADLAKSTKRDVFIDIQEVLKPELDAQLVSESMQPASGGFPAYAQGVDSRSASAARELKCVSGGGTERNRAANGICRAAAAACARISTTGLPSTDRRDRYGRWL